ncbi:MAG: SGNH/GDSL hydrolase family protein [Rhodospirillales bacterium]|nr:SGNH/GDSL hydrolase family protein [Rhodospirillales bacterium]
MSIKNVLVICAVVAATVVAGELGARIWLWTPSTLGAEPAGDRLGNSRYAFAPDVPGDLVPGQDGHWVVWWRRPYHVVTNSQGFRSLEEPQPGFRQIVALGDSQTFGPYVATEDTWPAWVQSELRRQKLLGRVQVHNGGVSGYTLADELAWLREKGIALKPDMVLLGVFENDILDYRRITTGRGLRPVSSTDGLGAIATLARELRTGFLRDLALYALAAQLRRQWEMRAANIDIVRGEGDAARERPEVEAARLRQYTELYERDFREFVRLAKESGIAVAVVAIPSPSVLAEGQTAEVGPLAGRLSQELGVPFLDLMPTFAAVEDSAQRYYLLHWSVELNALTGNGHLSREGHYEIGRRVAEWLAWLG